MSSDEKKKKQQAEASRRWRERNPQLAKAVGLKSYYRRQIKEGKSPRVLRTLEERREYQREWAKERRKLFPETAKAKGRKHYRENRDSVLSRASAYYQKNKEKLKAQSRARGILKKYGLTLEQYDALGAVCGICGIDGSGSRFRLSVDHDHTTGKVRGKLCHGCNTGLGGFRDSSELLQKAIDYLLKV